MAERRSITVTLTWEEGEPGPRTVFDVAVPPSDPREIGVMAGRLMGDCQTIGGRILENMESLGDGVARQFSLGFMQGLASRKVESSRGQCREVPS